MINRIALCGVAIFSTFLVTQVDAVSASATSGGTTSPSTTLAKNTPKKMPTTTLAKPPVVSTTTTMAPTTTLPNFPIDPVHSGDPTLSTTTTVTTPATNGDATGVAGSTDIASVANSTSPVSSDVAQVVAKTDPWAKALAPYMVAVPTTIDRTGKTDVTDQLNYLLSILPNRRILVFPANSRYRVEGTLTLQNHYSIVIVGQNSTFFSLTKGNIPPGPGCNVEHWPSCSEPERGRSHWNFVLDKNVYVTGVNVVGDDTQAGPNGIYDSKLEGQHGFNIAGDTNLTLNHVSAKNVWGDTVYVGVGGNDRYSTGIIVENSTFSDSSRMGWSVTDATHVTFRNNSVKNAKRSLIDLEANIPTNHIQYVSFINNQLGGSRFCTLSNYGSPAIEDHIVFSYNKKIVAGHMGICVQGPATTNRRSDYTFIGNHGSALVNPEANDDPMMTLTNVDNVTAHNNSQMFSNYWPYRGYIGPQAPITLKCSLGTVDISGNNFEPRPPNMPEYVKDKC